MPVTLDELAPLRDDMLTKGLIMQSFRYSLDTKKGLLVFDVVFVVDEEPPYGLLFGVAGGVDAFLFDVWADLTVRDRMETEDYWDLRRVLSIEPGGDRPWSHFDFLRKFNASGQIPNSASPRRQPRPESVPRPSRHVDDADKPYFFRWMPHGGVVSKKNYNRTRTIMGAKIAKFCRKSGISSQWTSDPKLANAVTFPPGFQNRRAA